MEDGCDWARRQCDEVESLQAIFSEEGAVCVDTMALQGLRELGERGGGTPPPPLALSVRLQTDSLGAGGGDVAAPGVTRLALVLPHGYPGTGEGPVLWLEPDVAEDITMGSLAIASSIVEDKDLCEQLQGAAAELSAAGEECLLPLLQHAEELLCQRLEDTVATAAAAGAEGAAREEEDNDEALACALFQEELEHVYVGGEEAGSRPTLGRRAMFSHHIIANSKRQAIRDWALQLRLGALAKIGWPGLIIIEGDERHVRAYVDALSRLRWKHFVVRGEQVVEGQAGQSLDELRALPPSFEEFGADGMSELATRCRQCGLEELFLSCMKIYGGAPSAVGGSAKRRGKEATAAAGAGASQQQQRRGRHR